MQCSRTSAGRGRSRASADEVNKAVTSAVQTTLLRRGEDKAPLRRYSFLSQSQRHRDGLIFTRKKTPKVPHRFNLEKLGLALDGLLTPYLIWQNGVTSLAKPSQTGARLIFRSPTHVPPILVRFNPVSRREEGGKESAAQTLNRFSPGPNDPTIDRESVRRSVAPSLRPSSCLHQTDRHLVPQGI